MFISKGHWSWGISGGYLRTYNVSPSFSYFLADDLSLGVSLDYSGYSLDTDIRLDFRNMFDINNIVSELDYLAFQVGYVHYIAPKKR